MFGKDNKDHAVGSDKTRIFLTNCGRLMIVDLPKLGAAFIVAFVLLALAATGAMAAEKLRVGVLKFGKVNWELNTLKDGKFDKENGVDVEIVALAGEAATAVALRAGAVDVIVSYRIGSMCRERAPLAMI